MASVKIIFSKELSPTGEELTKEFEVSPDHDAAHVFIDLRNFLTTTEDQFYRENERRYNEQVAFQARERSRVDDEAMRAEHAKREAERAAEVAKATPADGVPAEPAPTRPEAPAGFHYDADGELVADDQP